MIFVSLFGLLPPVPLLTFFLKPTQIFTEIISKEIFLSLVNGKSVLVGYKWKVITKNK